MNLINTCRNISLHSEEILFNWQQEILYRFAIDWRCPFLDAIASPSTYLCQSVSEWVSESLVVSDLRACWTTDRLLIWTLSSFKGILHQRINFAWGGVKVIWLRWGSEGPPKLMGVQQKIPVPRGEGPWGSGTSKGGNLSHQSPGFSSPMHCNAKQCSGNHFIWMQLLWINLIQQ